MVETATATTADTTTTTATTETNWRAALPEELKADKTLATVKDIPSLAKMVVEGQKFIGSAIKLPAKDAKPEEVTKWITEHGAKVKGIPGLFPEGAPATPEAYTIQRPEIALDLPWDENLEKGFFGAAHKVGMSNAQVQTVISYYGDMITRQVLDAQDQAKQTEGTLRTEWGPNYDANLGRANRAIQEFGGQPLIDLFTKSGMGRHPLVVKAFVGIGNALVEHGALPASGPEGVTPGEAATRITEIRADKAHAFNHPSHKDHVAALDEIAALTRIAHRGGA